MNGSEYMRAVAYPIFSRDAGVFILFALLLFIAGASISLPAQGGGFLGAMYDFVVNNINIGYLAERTDFPLAFALSYGFSMFFGLLFVIRRWWCHVDAERPALFSVTSVVLTTAAAARLAKAAACAGLWPLYKPATLPHRQAHDKTSRTCAATYPPLGVNSRVGSPGAANAQGIECRLHRNQAIRVTP